MTTPSARRRGRWGQAAVATLLALACAGLLRAWLAPENVAAWLSLSAFCG